MLKSDPRQTEFVDFYVAFGGKLKATNRWVRLAGMMPWQEVEECYASSLAGTGMGSPAKSGRIAYGALVIKERPGITGGETVGQITGNPYLQYFPGLHEYREEALFDPSMMVHFRSRFGEAGHQRINNAIIGAATGSGQTEPGDSDAAPPPSNAGKLLTDATCTPADITCPTGLKLLGEAREKTELYIDALHAPDIGKKKKPRTCRQKARSQYLAVAKQKKPGRGKIRKAIGRQLRYIRRNPGHIDKMLENGASPGLLSKYQLRCLQVIHELHRQQSPMHGQRSQSVPNRIVSISQPHIRPIVRGKAGKKVEFGAKVSISHLAGGYVALDRLSWESHNENADLVEQAGNYRQRFGHYPASIHADQIYRTRENRRYCRERNIRLSGKALGRPKKQTEENKEQLKAERKQTRQDELDRIPVEGKFGNAKRKGTLARIMAKLAHTAESVVHVGIVVLNLDKWLRQIIFWLCLVGTRSLSWCIRALRSGLNAHYTQHAPQPHTLETAPTLRFTA